MSDLASPSTRDTVGSCILYCRFYIQKEYHHVCLRLSSQLKAGNNAEVHEGIPCLLSELSVCHTIIELWSRVQGIASFIILLLHGTHAVWARYTEQAPGSHCCCLPSTENIASRISKTQTFSSSYMQQRNLLIRCKLPFREIGASFVILEPLKCFWEMISFHVTMAGRHRCIWSQVCPCYRRNNSKNGRNKNKMRTRFGSKGFCSPFHVTLAGILSTVTTLVSTPKTQHSVKHKRQKYILQMQANSKIL